MAGGTPGAGAEPPDCAPSGAASWMARSVAEASSSFGPGRERGRSGVMVLVALESVAGRGTQNMGAVRVVFRTPPHRVSGPGVVGCIEERQARSRIFTGGRC